MSKPGLAFGLSFNKKPGASKLAAPKKKLAFGGDDSDDEGANGGAVAVEAIGGDFDDFDAPRPKAAETQKKPAKATNGSQQPPKLKPKAGSSAMFGDLASDFASRQKADAAADLDASVYEYDAVYDSIKPRKQITKEDKERKPKYMRSVMEAAEVRKRDALIAEEKKIAREREEEGEEFADKEKFVTEAYKKQQEENRRTEEEEKRKEEEEAKKNKGGGMSAFYKKLLDKGEERHSEAVKAAEEMAKEGLKPNTEVDEDVDEAALEAQRAQELSAQGVSVALNEDGQVVDKRQLLKGGLNLGAAKKDVESLNAERPRERDAQQQRGGYASGAAGRKQAMRERQSRMMEEQLAESTKRAREEEEAQRAEVERAAKSRKTEGEISSAKERYLARKRAAEEEKKTRGGG